MEKQIFIKSGIGRASDFLKENGVQVLRLHQSSNSEEFELVVRSADLERARDLLDLLKAEGVEYRPQLR
jgi:hypothetical protein